MLLSFRDAGTSEVFDGVNSRAANRVCDLQMRWNLYAAQQAERQALSKIHPCKEVQTN